MTTTTEETYERWWNDINTLALVELMISYARQPSDKDKADMPTLNSSLIGAARTIGIHEDLIRKACESDRMLTICPSGLMHWRSASSTPASLGNAHQRQP